MTYRAQKNEAGFVLPYVLVVIAILAIAGTIAAQRLQKASAVVGDMQERLRAEQVLQSAEVAATYSILTGNPVTGGYDISTESPIAWEFGFLSPDGRRPLREGDANAVEKNLWTGNGYLRRYDKVAGEMTNEDDAQAPQAIIAYQDVSGLASLNNGSPHLLLPIFEAVGASRAEAQELLDTLNDYTDPDSRRRTRGAEDFDYRTQKFPPPPNAPLRSYEELGQVMGWAEVMPRLDMQALKDMTTLKMSPGFRLIFASDELKTLVGGVMGGEDGSLMPSQSIDLMTQVALNNRRPSQFARFIMWVPRADGRYQKRVVDIQRFLGGVGEPYRRHLVYDSTVLESDLKRYAGPFNNTQTRPLQFDELDHVVHAPSLRP